MTRGRHFFTIFELEDRITPTADPFTLVALPDTQRYAQYPQHNHIFYEQMQWIVDHKAAENIVFVTALGDIVNNSNTTQYAVADAAYDILDGNLTVNPDGIIPYSPTMGNHDFTQIGVRSSGAPLYIQNFGSQRFAGRSWYGGHYRDLNHYQFFSGGGYNFLQISLEYEAPDEVLDWAREVIRTHPGMPTIISTHSYAYDVSQSRRITRQSSDGNSGEAVWNKLIYPNPQIFMVLNGHFDSTAAATPGEWHQVSSNILGLPVIEITSDYQEQEGQASGLLRLHRFDPATNTIQVKTYAPTYDTFRTGPSSQFEFSFDFASRFSAASPDPVRVAAFQDGVDLGFGPYYGTLDTQLLQSSPNTSYGEDPADLLVDYPDANNAAQALLRFNNIFGSGPGQVPLGSRILSATLTVDSNNAGDGGTFHRMIQDWSETSTWNSLGNGVQTGTEARTASDTQAGTSALTPDIPAMDKVTINVTSDIAAWSAGGINRGWVILPFLNAVDGWAFAPSESATPALRPKLRIEWMPAAISPNTKTTVIQQGINGYGGTVDTYLSQIAPTTDYASATRFFVDKADAGNEATSLLRFDNLFGVAPNQVRPDAQIDAAYLYLTTPYDNANAHGGGAKVNRTITLWQASDTWGNAFGTDGIQLDGIEAVAVPDLNTGSVEFGVVRLDVTKSVKSWQAGQANRGWVFTANSTDGWFVATSESEAVADRPRLEVISQNLPPRVVAADMNDGAPQRSQVRSVRVEFSAQVVGTTPAAFELKHINGAVADAQLNLQIVDGRTIAILDQFTGSGSANGSLIDGRWTLRVKSSVQNLYGQALDGNGDGTSGDDFLLIGDAVTNRFFRLFGDYDGNGAVDASDFAAFGDAFGQTDPGSPFDFNGDGTIHANDFAEFGNRFGVTL